MGLRVENIRLVHRVVGTKHVFTSPDVPELHISHADKDVAYASLQPALDALAAVKTRVSAREAVRRQMKEKAVA